MRVNKIGCNAFGNMGGYIRKTWDKCKNAYGITYNHVNKHKKAYKIGSICFLGVSACCLYAYLTSEAYERKMERKRYEKMLAKIQEQRRLNMLG